MSLKSRCTRCGTVNDNAIPAHMLKHGGGREHGTEVVPCEECGAETVQNRCKSSVPSPKR